MSKCWEALYLRGNSHSLCSNNANINFTLKPLANFDTKFGISPSVFLRLSQLLPIQCVSKGLWKELVDSSLMGILLDSFPRFLRLGVSVCAALLAKGHCSPHSEPLSTVERFSERPSEDQGHPNAQLQSQFPHHKYKILWNGTYSTATRMGKDLLRSMNGRVGVGEVWLSMYSCRKSQTYQGHGPEGCCEKHKI